MMFFVLLLPGVVVLAIAFVQIVVQLVTGGVQAIRWVVRRAAWFWVLTGTAAIVQAVADGRADAALAGAVLIFVPLAISTVLRWRRPRPPASNDNQPQPA